MKLQFRSCAGAALAALLLSFTAGCSYRPKELYRQDVRSVAVPVFASRTFYQGVEFDVTEALIKEIELRTPYKVVGEAGADSILTGTVVDVDQVRLSRRREGGLPQENELRIVVNFEWRNLRTGEVILDRQGFEAIGRYVPTRPVLEPQNIAQHQAIESLATEIVSVMRSDW